MWYKWWVVCVSVSVRACVWGGSGGGLGEGQGCVYNVNSKGDRYEGERGKKERRPHPVSYILFHLIVLYFCGSLKTRDRPR